MKRFLNATVLWVLLLAVLPGTGSAFAEAWKFAVMGDTQWTCPTDPAGKNPNNVSVSIIDQINRRLIEHGVRFVIQVGDLTENGNDPDIETRARAAQSLYDAGIGFFPMRGNHETMAKPEGSTRYAIPAMQKSFPQTRGGNNTFGATNFSSPVAVSADLDGMSYSFDYSNARFVIIDNWATPTKRVDAADYRYGYSIADQQAWINDRLDKSRRGTIHAFVFSHQNLMGENHQDSIFTGFTNENPAMQNEFYASLLQNGARYYISGHDHIHQRSLVASPDGASRIEELIAAPASSKFYTPKSLTDAKWHGQKVRETSLSQETYTIGYYIYTVDGPRVTVDYYADDHGNWASDTCYPDGATPQTCTAAGSQVTPVLHFVKKETWGYSQNGKEVLVPQGEGYELTDDTSKAVADGEPGYLHTMARILSGTNASTRKDYNGRPLAKTVDTGWAPRGNKLLASDIFTLWGMADLGAGSTDIYVLAITYDSRLAKHPGTGRFGIATKKPDGTWVNAAEHTVGGTKKFVRGPWKSRYGLGTCGVDRRTKTAWVVVNYTGSFAVSNGPPSGKRK